MSQKSQEIDSLAADWAARRDLGNLACGEEAEFQAWLSADVRHLGAYGRAEAVLSRLERLNSATVESASPENAEPSAWSRRRMVLTGGAAASVAAAIGTGFYLSGRSEDGMFSTAIGEIREVVLADGSVVFLNTDTRIQVRFTQASREISLLSGEALFDVAKNRKRPFIVSAGDTRVRAVGTSFTVSMLPQKPIEVLVREGIVELQRSSLPEDTPVRASANIKALAPMDAPIVTMAMPEERLSRNLAWQRGQIAFDNQTLEDAATEFARYSEVHVVVDPAISGKTVTGLFASNDPVAFAKAAASVLKLRVEVSGNEVRIF
jgi:transmembrane sensor